MKNVNASLSKRRKLLINTEDYKDPRDRIITVKLPEHEYRSAREMAKACRVSVGQLARGLILCMTERNKQLFSIGQDTKERHEA